MANPAQTPEDPALTLEGGTIEPGKPASEGRAVAAHQAQPLQHAPAPRPMALDPMAIVQIMERMAKNKEVDIGKMKEAREMVQSLISDHNEAQFNAAMAEAQAEMQPVRADAYNDHTKSAYGSESAIDRALRPIYTRHGFSLSFNTAPDAPEGYVRILCYVSCRGHTRTYQHDVASDGKGARGGDVMTKTHAGGAATTYGRRYLKRMIFDIPVDRDDDGNAAGQKTDDRPKVNEVQVKALKEACKAVGCPEAKFLKWASRDTIQQLKRFEDIPAELFDGCLHGLKEFKKAE